MDNITIDNFDGPLDLLLHLIKISQMDIMNIKLEIIIDKYLDYIKQMDELNLDVASSYLVMASELIEIKSRKLLPRQEEIVEEDDLENNLIDRLKAYELYKEQIPYLRNLEQERNNYYTKIPSSISEYQGDNAKLHLDGVDVNDLVEAFKKFLERVENDKPLNTTITRKELSVEDSVIDIRKKIMSKKRINFFDLFASKSKSYVIVTFLAILELACQKEIRIIQDNNFDNIICEVVNG